MKLNRYFLPMAALAFLMQGCAEDNQTDWQNRVPITLKTIMVEGDITRSENVNIQSTQFDKGETFYAYFPENVLVGSEPEVKSTTFTLQEDGSTWTPVIQPYFADGANLTATVHAYYPSTVTEATTSFTVEKDQSQTSGYRNSDLMYATTTVTKSGTTSEGSLAFSHKMAKIIVHASAGQGVTKIQEVRIVGGYRGIDIATPLSCTLGTTLSQPNSDSESNYITMFKSGNNGYADCAALIPPQTLDGDKEFLKIVTDAGIAVYKIGKEIESANSYMLNLTVSSTSISEATTISNWSNNSGSSSAGELVIGDIADYTWDGTTAFKPTPTVSYNNVPLNSGTDYVLYYLGDNINPGNPAVLAVGIGNYNGKFGISTYTIKKKPANITLSSQSTLFVYGYESNSASITVTLSDSEESTRVFANSGNASYYSVSSGNIDNGTSTITLTGLSGGSADITISATSDHYTYSSVTNLVTVVPPPTTLAELKSWVLAEQDFSIYPGYEVNSEGKIGETVSGTVIGYIACIINSEDVEESVSGSRILVISNVNTLTNTAWSTSRYAYGASNDGARNGLNFTITHTDASYTAVAAALGMGTPSIEGASRWFIPSYSQWNLCYGNYSSYQNATICNIGKGSIDTFYNKTHCSSSWSITEYSSSDNRYIIVPNGGGYLAGDKTSGRYNVRTFFVY